VRAFRPLRLRLTLWYVLLLAIILAAFSAGIYLTLRHNLYANLDDSVETRANDLLAMLNFEGDSPTLSGRLATESSDLGEQFIRVYDRAGQVTFDTTRDAGPAAIDGAAVGRALGGHEVTRGATVGGDPFRIRIVPIEHYGQVIGALEVGRTAEDVADTQSSLLLILAIAYPLTIGAASAGGLFLANRALSPIDRITRTARRITAEDLSQRLNLRLPEDEVGRLARTFDEMIARLDHAFRRQRQFTADASHEMRTPLTAIKGQVEVALSRPRGLAAYREVIQTVNEEVDRLIRLVGLLLTLARADTGQIPISAEAVSLPDLVAGALEQQNPAAREKGIALSIAGSPAVTLKADEDLLLQLLLNLLDNAIKYTPPGGQVTVGWNLRGRQVELWVRDTGIGIASQHLPHLFDRFYRVDKARARAEGGAGLGLSICRWIAEAHGGSISAESAPGQGTTFRVVLPAAD